MSGGRWGYMKHRFVEDAYRMKVILEAVAQSEQICDWAESSDASREDAQKELYDLWVSTFNGLLG